MTPNILNAVEISLAKAHFRDAESRRCYAQIAAVEVLRNMQRAEAHYQRAHARLCAALGFAVGAMVRWRGPNDGRYRYWIVIEITAEFEMSEPGQVVLYGYRTNARGRQVRKLPSAVLREGERFADGAWRRILP